jgi:hypothetical protein
MVLLLVLSWRLVGGAAVAWQELRLGLSPQLAGLAGLLLIGPAVLAPACKRSRLIQAQCNCQQGWGGFFKKHTCAAACACAAKLVAWVAFLSKKRVMAGTPSTFCLLSILCSNDMSPVRSHSAGAGAGRRQWQAPFPCYTRCYHYVLSISILGNTPAVRAASIVLVCGMQPLCCADHTASAA